MKRTTIYENGHTFDSVSKRNRYRVLLKMQEAGEIRSLTVRKGVTFYLQTKNCDFSYIADFSYKKGILVQYEDVDREITPDISLRREVLFRDKNIKIRDVW